MSFFNRNNNIKDTEYNNFNYNDDFSICLGALDPDISEDVVSFHPNTERINDDVLVNAKKVYLTDTKIRIINSQIFGSSVEEILFPHTLLSIKGGFENSNLKTVDFKNTKIESLDRCIFKGCTDLENVSLPESLRKIKDEAFADCKKLKKLDLSNTLLGEIPRYTFNGCQDLEEVLLSDLTFSIGAYAFKGTSLSTIDLKNVKKVDLSAFLNTDIECIYLPDSISSVSFDGIKGKDIKIPSLLVNNEEDYKRLKRFSEVDLERKLKVKPIKRLNVSYSGNDDEVLKTLKFLEGSGFIKVIE